MKEFVVYTGLRLLMFAATFGVVIGRVARSSRARRTSSPPCVIAFVVSGIGSYFLLNRQREAFAQRVEVRAERATKAFEQLRAKEDVD